MRLPRRCAPRNDRRNDMGGKHMRMCTVSTGGRQLGSNPAPPSTRLVPAGVDLLFFFSCLDRRERPARRLKAPAVIRSIGVVVTPLPSKQVSPVRVRYAAPPGLYLGVVESPSFKLTAGKDLPAGLTSSGGYTVQRERPQVFFTCCSPLGKAVRLCLAPPTTAEVVAFILTVGKDRPAGVVHRR